MTRAPSSHALARDNASSVEIGAGAPFDLADFCAAICRRRQIKRRLLGKGRGGDNRGPKQKHKPSEAFRHEIKSFRLSTGAPNRRLERPDIGKASPFRKHCALYMAGSRPLRGYRTSLSVASSAPPEALHDRVDLAPVDDEGRGQKNVVAVNSIDRPAHWIDHQTQRHRLALDARMQFGRGIKRPLAGAVADQLKRPKETAPANVADGGVLSEALLEAPLKPCAHLDDVAEQSVPAG